MARGRSGGVSSTRKGVEQSLVLWTIENDILIGIRLKTGWG